MSIDFIGDVHGHASELEALLRGLGWRERGGVFRHPDPLRRAVFLGDLVDRGPEQLRAVDIARRMRDAGVADVLLGNHEHNAIGYATRDEGSGRHLRVRGSKNRNQHRAFLEAVGEDSPLHLELVGWMKTLPVFLDLGHAKAVHACWHGKSIAAIAAVADEDGLLSEEAMCRTFIKGDPLREAAEIAMKGVEVDLPEGVSFFDKDGHERRKARAKWWTEEVPTYADGLFAEGVALPDEPLPEDVLVRCDDVVFFGHYWMEGMPRLVSEKRACLDFSIAKGGSLCAYSWDGEPTLLSERMSWVDGFVPDLEAAPIRAMN